MCISDKSRGISLLQAGYTSLGLDDGYQACGEGINGSFHTASGYPVIDRSKFPDMKAMTAHAHALGLRIGWCTCMYMLPCSHRHKCYECGYSDTIPLNFVSVCSNWCLCLFVRFFVVCFFAGQLTPAAIDTNAINAGIQTQFL